MIQGVDAEGNPGSNASDDAFRRSERLSGGLAINDDTEEKSKNSSSQVNGCSPIKAWNILSLEICSAMRFV